MKTKKYLYGLSALLLSASFGSCAFESDTAVSPTANEKTFTLNVTTGAVGDLATRGATSIASDATVADTKGTDEKKVSSLVWGIFHAAADADQGKKVYSKDWTTTAEGQSSFTLSSHPFDAGELSFQAGDEVLVAANLSNDKLTTYEGLASKTLFQQEKLGISEALTAGTGSVNPAKLPMFGTSTVTDTDGSSTSFSSNVTVKHLVAKVTLNSLSVEFTGTGHESATFKPLEVFLINVPDELTMEYDGTNYTPTGLTLTNLYQGEADSWTSHAAATKRKFADYLGTGSVAEETLDGTDTYSKRYSLYTMPYNFTETSVTYASANTRLVIKGEYRPAGGNDAVDPMYYAVNLNNGTGDYKIKPNTHYKVTATIKGPGADNAYDAIPLYQNFTANVSYEDWTEEGTTATIGNGGIQWAQTAPDYTGIAVGDLIYADGYWNSSYDADFATLHGAPIAIVFSTETTAYDQDQAQNGLGNFTHGYAMALKRYNSGNNVANWCATALQNTQVTDILIPGASNLATLKADKDGLKHCRTAYKYIDDNGGNYSDLTAIYAAINGYNTEVPAPEGTSGWYLPSIGQQYSWLQAAETSVAQSSKKFPGDEAWSYRTQYDDWYIGERVYAADKLNTWTSGKGLTSGMYEGFDQGHYLWSSTERTASNPFCLNFYTDASLYLCGDVPKSSSILQVRAVLAF